MLVSVPQNLICYFHIYLLFKLCDATIGKKFIPENTLDSLKDVQHIALPQSFDQSYIENVVDHSLVENDDVHHNSSGKVNRIISGAIISSPIQNVFMHPAEICDAKDIKSLPQMKPETPISNLKENFEEKINFFVVTAIFNPASYKSRYDLYQNFAQHMNNTGAQLITIECIFPSLNQTKFQVTDKNNPWHIQLKSESIYWMKENLINIAVSRLPPHAKWISWLDADLEFEHKNWVELTIKELKKYTVVQVFETAKFLGPTPKNEVLRTDYSFGYSVVHSKPIDPKNFYAEWYPHRGYGWAMRVKDFWKINGLPDYAIVGSGDRFFAFSLINRVLDTFTRYEPELNPAFRKMILDNSNTTFHKLEQLSKSSRKQIVGYVPVTIKHYWHGSKKYRHIKSKWLTLVESNFNFLTDIIANQDGLFQLNPTKPQLQKDILAYFQMRKEDTVDTYSKDRKS